MTVAEQDDLAQVFEYLGNACIKLSQILKQQRTRNGAVNTILDLAKPVISRVTTAISSANSSGKNLPNGFASSTETLQTAETNGAMNGAGRRRKRAPADPSAPKRPPSAFILFCKEKRGQLSTEHPGLSFKEINIHLGKAWDAADQRPFYEKAAGLRKQYFEERENYIGAARNSEGMANMNISASLGRDILAVVSEDDSIGEVVAAVVSEEKKKPLKKLGDAKGTKENSPGSEKSQNALPTKELAERDPQMPVQMTVQSEKEGEELAKSSDGPETLKRKKIRKSRIESLPEPTGQDADAASIVASQPLSVSISNGAEGNVFPNAAAAQSGPKDERDEGKKKKKRREEEKMGGGFNADTQLLPPTVSSHPALTESAAGVSQPEPGNPETKKKKRRKKKKSPEGADSSVNLSQTSSHALFP